jgi:hypothetical protein
LSHDSLIMRLAAANPAPADLPVPITNRTRSRRRLCLAAVLAAAAVAVPAVAFADSIEGLLGISNQGTTVVASQTPFSSFPELNAAMQHLGLTTMQLLGTEQGISFYAARNPAGHFCFAIASLGATGVGCRLDNEFPSTQDPLIDIFSTPRQIAGFAADNVAEIGLLGSSGNTLETIPVTGNIYALSSPPAGVSEVEALDANGNVITSHSIPETP